MYVLVELIIEASHYTKDYLIVDIHTQHTSLCSKMPYSFVWLYLMKCVFTCSIFVNSSTKRFLSVFRCFWKVFCLKNLNISKIQCCPVLAAQSRVCQVASLSRVFAGHFWRLVREWKVQSRGLLRDFRGSSRDSLAGISSSREKHLEKFFKFLSLSVLAAWSGDSLATRFSRENRVFHGLGVMSKSQNPLLHRFFTIALT